MGTKHVKNLIYGLGLIILGFASCKKNGNSDTGIQFGEGGYRGRIVITMAREGNIVQTILPANISFKADSFSVNYIPGSQLGFVDVIPYSGHYQLQSGNTAITLNFIPPVYIPSLTAPDYAKGRFDISNTADSLILTQNLPDGVSSYQYRLKLFRNL